MKKLIFSLAIGIASTLFLSPVTLAGPPSITSSGIGKVKTGTNISKLPKQIAGVYDKLELVSEEFVDEGAFEDVISLYRATLEGQTVIEFYPDGDKVGNITIYSNNLQTKKGLSLNSTPSELFSAGGKVISFNDGGEAFLCDGLLFIGVPMTQKGYQKSEQAYFGERVSFDESDFEENGHPTEILISEYYAKEYSATPKSSRPSGKDVWDTILGIIFILAVIGMIAHMVYVNYFTKPYPESFDSENATPENNTYVKSTLEALYNGEFTPLCDPNEAPVSDIVNYPVGKKVAYHAKEVLDDIMANHLPVNGEAASLLNIVAAVTNDAYKRTFAGSKAFIVVAIIVTIGMCCITKEAYPIIYLGLSSVMYWFASRTPNYILIDKELKAAKSGKQSKSFMTGAIAGILGLAATAPVYVEVTKNANTGEIIDKQEDHSMTWIALVFSVILLIAITYLMIFVGIFNYLRNYVLRK